MRRESYPSLAGAIWWEVRFARMTRAEGFLGFDSTMDISVFRCLHNWGNDVSRQRSLASKRLVRNADHIAEIYSLEH
jgi:hypothetical protein